MQPDFAQRRRVAIAAAITIVAVPSAFLLGRDDPSGAPDSTAVAATIGTVPGNTQPAPVSTLAPESAGPLSTDPMGTAPVGYLDGTPPEGVSDPATIAVPRLPESIEGTASFRRDIASASVCQVPGVQFNTTVTVTNLDNSRSIQCLASVRGASPVADVVLHVDAFERIADLTDAPVPVEVTW